MAGFTIGWGASTVATKYVYQRLHNIMDMEDEDSLNIALAQFYSELARNYYRDTGQRIGDPHG